MAQWGGDAKGVHKGGQHTSKQGGLTVNNSDTATGNSETATEKIDHFSDLLQFGRKGERIMEQRQVVEVLEAELREEEDLNRKVADLRERIAKTRRERAKSIESKESSEDNFSTVSNNEAADVLQGTDERSSTFDRSILADMSRFFPGKNSEPDVSTPEREPTTTAAAKKAG